MTSGWVLVAALPLLIWLHLVTFRGQFWRADQRLNDGTDRSGDWPEVVAVVPARDEADTIGEALDSLLAQCYPGAFSIIVVDDQSSDETAQVVRAKAARTETAQRLQLVATETTPPGWTGKVSAMATGVVRAQEEHPDARYILFTDADIQHDPTNLKHLVGKAEDEHYDLVSLMVRLAHRGLWQRLLIPAFVFFFQKLYPFAWVNDPNRRTAAAAGGCVLVRSDALADAGGLEAIKGNLIDDCALARLIAVRGGKLWLGLTGTTQSLRPYDGVAGVWRMVARSAYIQLGHSIWALLGTILGMLATYLLAPLLVIAAPMHGDMTAALISLGAWGLMAVAFMPTLKLYEVSRPTALLLPAAGLLYTLMTVDSARRHWQGRGGHWKGRVQAPKRALEPEDADTP